MKLRAGQTEQAGQASVLRLGKTNTKLMVRHWPQRCCVAGLCGHTVWVLLLKQVANSLYWMECMKTKSMEEINFQHILERKGFSSTEARRKFSNAFINLRGGVTFISNLCRSVEDICWKDLISLRIGVDWNIPSNTCSLIFESPHAESFFKVPVCLVHHSYIYFCILDSIDTGDVKKTNSIFVWFFFSQASFACIFRLLPEELLWLFMLLCSPRIKLYFYTDLKLTELIKYFTLICVCGGGSSSCFLMYV